MWTVDGVTLRPFELDDIDTVYEWYADGELDIYSSWGRVVSKTAFHDWMEQSIIRKPSSDAIVLGIVANDELVGRILLERVDLENRIASLGFNIKKGARGKGTGKIASRIIVDYGFKALNLEKIYAECYGFNVRAQRCLEAVGFQREGVLRRHELHNGERHDVHFFGMLKGEFYEKYLTLFTVPLLQESERGSEN